MMGRLGFLEAESPGLFPGLALDVGRVGVGRGLLGWAWAAGGIEAGADSGGDSPAVGAGLFAAVLAAGGAGSETWDRPGLAGASAGPFCACALAGSNGVPLGAGGKGASRRAN